MLSYLELHKLRESTKVLCISSCLESLDNHGNMQKLIFVPTFSSSCTVDKYQHCPNVGTSLPSPSLSIQTKPMRDHNNHLVSIYTNCNFLISKEPNFSPNEFLIALDLNKYWVKVALVGKCRFTKFGIGLAPPLPVAAQSIRVEKCKSNVMHKSRATVKRNVFCKNLLLMGRGVHRITFFSPLSQRPQEKKH